MILDEIKKDNVIAIKEKNANARAILSILMNKALLEQVKKREKGEQVTDVDMVAILQKTVKELTDEMQNYAKVNNTQQVEVIEKQIQIVKKYLPRMLSIEEIKEIIEPMPDKSVPTVMKKFKAEYAGKVDMKDVQTVIKMFN